eukprot:864949-Prymnesium_polylepis.1
MSAVVVAWNSRLVVAIVNVSGGGAEHLRCSRRKPDDALADNDGRFVQCLELAGDDFVRGQDKQRRNVSPLPEGVRRFITRRDERTERSCYLGSVRVEQYTFLFAARARQIWSSTGWRLLSAETHSSEPTGTPTWSVGMC